MLNRHIPALLVTLALILPAAADELSISGQVTYKERIALPPEPALRIRLVDADRLDAPPVVAAEAAVAGGVVPLTFTLRFDDSLIQEGRSYAITAEITSAGSLWFSSFSPHPVDPTDGILTETIVLDFAGRADAPATTGAVSTEADDEVGAAPLLDIVWEAKSIGGEPVDPTSAPSLTIAGDLRVGGRGGCNSYFAQAWLQGEQLQFSAVAATKMSCSSSMVMDLEARYFLALQRTRFWRRNGDGLLLLDEAGRELLRFGPSGR